MAKTQRRRAARLARQDAATTTHSEAERSRRAAAALITNHMWRQFTDTLEGLLLLEFPSPVTDLELLCPQEAWIVVDLAFVRVDVRVAKSKGQGMQRVIAALETICVLGETLRAWSDLYEAFRTRVLTSDMNQEQLCDNDHRVGGMIRFMRAKGTHVAFRWRGKRLRSKDTIMSLRQFLDSRLHGIRSSTKPVHVALRVEDCEISTTDLKTIHEVLKSPSDFDSSDLLCDAFTLKQLSLRSNALYTLHHEALTALLADPAVRRIDSFQLDDTTPHDQFQPPTYASVVQRTLSMGLNTKPPSPFAAAHDPGVSLSLDNCKRLNAELIEAIGNAFMHATRPVRALSLAGVTPFDSGSFVRLMRLIHTPLPTATNEFQLDITGLNNERGQSEAEEALIVSLEEMVVEAVPRINSALGDRISCRLFSPQVFEDQFLTVPVKLPVATFVFYDVVVATHHGLFQVVLPEVDKHGHNITGWVSFTSIASIRVGETYIVGSNCTSLIFNGAKDQYAASFCPGFVAGVAVTIGAGLKRLSLRNYCTLFNDVPSLIARCPQLVELNVNNSTGYGSYNDMWSQTTPDTGRFLQVRNISDCSLTATGLSTLPTQPSLRYLNVANNPLDGGGLFVNVSQTRNSRAHAEQDAAAQDYAARKTEIETHSRDEYITLNTRIAFLSVVAHAETVRQCVPLDVIGAIFQFAGTSPRCAVSW